MEGGEFVLRDDLAEWLNKRAVRARRDLTEQLVYELRLNRALVPADPWDTEGAERAQVLRLILPGSRYLLKAPLRG
jgi:hypothetical protein